MKIITRENVKSLSAVEGGPCISIFQPTHRNHPENQQDPIRFKNLLKEIEVSLLKNYSEAEVKTLLEPFETLLHNTFFWNHTLEGLAVFGGPGTFQVYGLQRDVKPVAIVADSFHIKPLKKYLQTVDRFQVLCINRHDIKLFEGSRNYLDEIELDEEIPQTISQALGDELTEEHITVASYGGAFGNAPNVHGHGGKKDEVGVDTERFFRAVDRAILEHHSKPTGLPLLLAALPEYHTEFAKLSHNRQLMNEGIKINPKSLTNDELRERAWKVFEPQYLDQLDKLAAEYNLAASKNLGTDNLRAVAKAAAEGKVATLLVEENRLIPGRIVDDLGKIKFDEIENPEVDDLLDDLGELVEKMGGSVMIIPAERMPNKAGVAATFRY